jgi:holliday junction DNA helicase RuvB
MQQYAPQNLNEFIGQPNIRRMLRVTVEASLQRNRPCPHIIFTGPSGLGKSTLAQIVARMQGGKFIECLAGKLSDGKDWKELFHQVEGRGYRTDIDAEQCRKIAMEQGVEALVAQGRKVSKSVVFLDEIHRLSQKQQEQLYTLMTKNILYYTEKNPLTKALETKWTPVPLFTLVGATTEEGKLETPFFNRFALHLKLEPYSVEELEKIAANAVAQANYVASTDAVSAIAHRSRGVARVALNFVTTCSNYALLRNSREITIDEVITSIVFSDSHLCIDEMGLTLDDLRYLYALYLAEHPIGLNTLVSILNADPKNVTQIIEPHLIRQGLIQITPSGRLIKRAGIEHIRKHPFLHKLAVGSDSLRDAINKDPLFEEVR